MAVRNRGVKSEYAKEMNQEGIATQVEMDDAFVEHKANDHTAEGLMPTPSEENMILKSYIDTEDNNEIKWKVVKADDPQEGLTVIALPYYWDDVREKYLDNQVVRVNMYKDGNVDDEWMYHIPRIRSDSVPYRLFEGEVMCIVGASFTVSEEASGVVAEIRNITGYTSSGWGGKTAEYDVMYTVDLGSDNTDAKMISDINLDLDSTFRLSGYVVADADLEDPVMTILMRKVWVVDDDS